MKHITKIINPNKIRNSILSIIKDQQFSIIKLVERYRIGRGMVLHVGANLGQECEAYELLGFTEIVWVEGWPPFADELESRLKDKKNHKIICAMISDIDNEHVEFSLTSNQGSSTALAVTNNWKSAFSSIDVIQRDRVYCKRLDNLLREYQVNPSIDFMVMDIEGSELKALRSMGSLLSNVKAALIEVSVRKNYIDGPLLRDIDSYMLANGFLRVYLKSGAVSGDALYIRRLKITFFDEAKMHLSAIILRVAAELRLTDLFAHFKNLAKRFFIM